MRAPSASSTVISRFNIDFGASVPLWWFLTAMRARSSRPAPNVSHVAARYFETFGDARQVFAAGAERLEVAGGDVREPAGWRGGKPADAGHGDARAGDTAVLRLVE